MRRVTVWCLIPVMILLVAWGPAEAASPQTPSVFPGREWQWVDRPGDAGWSSAKLALAREYAGRIGSAAVMIVQHGVVIDAWGDLARKYKCHSMRKSLISALIGIYVAEGRIDLSKTMADLGIDDNPPALSATEKTATVHDLIRARSGVYHPALFESPSMKARRPKRHSHWPGTFWYYNNWDFNALGTIFRQETGLDIFGAFTYRIAVPLQMEDYQSGDGHYATGTDSIHAAYPFRMSTRDLARFGLLFLNGGCWDGRRVVPAGWVRESTAVHSRTALDSGYGYMWWTGVRGGLMPHVVVADHCYYAAGFRGHRVIVLPYLDLVVVHRVDTERSAVTLNNDRIGVLLWLILDAAGQRGIGEPVFIGAVPGTRLAAADLRDILPGCTLAGDGFRVAFSPRGRLTVQAREGYTDAGTWRIKGDAVVVMLEKQTAGKPERITLLRDGRTIKWFDDAGVLSGQGELEE